MSPPRAEPLTKPGGRADLSGRREAESRARAARDVSDDVRATRSRGGNFLVYPERPAAPAHALKYIETTPPRARPAGEQRGGDSLRQEEAGRRANWSMMGKALVGSAVFLLLAALGAAGASAADITRADFPAGFVFGVGSSAYQVRRGAMLSGSHGGGMVRDSDCSCVFACRLFAVFVPKRNPRLKLFEFVVVSLAD